MLTKTMRERLLASTVLTGALLMAAPAVAQDAGAAEETATTDVIVTGSRIARPNLESASPIQVVTGEEVVKQADITMEQFLNTLPQVNAAGGTTSNNPPNGGRSNIDLRGLGANRNIVLIDGRRPMVSANDQTVDINPIPQALIERIEIITGGAGATYGADAIAGVVNIRMKDNFSGVDLRATYSNSIPETDAREYLLSAAIGGNFADDRGNMTFAVDYAKRQELGKRQRDFAIQATSTTPTPPTGRYVDGQNPASQAAYNAVFGAYGSLAKDIPVSGGGGSSFNTDGTLFGTGTFNNPRDVTNFRYGIGSQTAAPNLNFFPDFYSYNFDIVNVLVLPLERKSAFMKGHYEISPAFDVFVQANYAEYTSATGSAPTPLGVAIENPCGTVNTRAKSSLVNCFNEVATLGATPGTFTTTRSTITGLVVPVTNPFIPADMRTLLASRIPSPTNNQNDPRLAGFGPTEPFNLAYRFLPTGLRRSSFDTQLYQVLGGVRGDISDNWRYEAYMSYGKTEIVTVQTGGVNVQRVQQLLEDQFGGAGGTVDGTPVAAICAGGFNPFGIQPLSQACIDYVAVPARQSIEFTQRIAQGYVTGSLAELPAGNLSVVFGAENRHFEYFNDPGALNGPIAGPNSVVPESGKNNFTDFFGELLVPLARDASWAKELELNLSARHSKSEFTNRLNNQVGGSTDWTYGATLVYAPVDELKFRGSYQRAVRAPNFGELFAGGSSFPQYFDPCSSTSVFRTSGGAAARALCVDTGIAGTAVDSYAQTPGSQVFSTVAGNTNLRPEKADTITAGFTFNAMGFIGSIDYYNIKVKDTILSTGLNPNVIVAACYGNYGLNTALSVTSPYCRSIINNRGPDISQLLIPPELGGNAAGAFSSINAGEVKTSGIDFQLGYNVPMDFVNEGSRLTMNMLVNYLIDYKVEELPGVTFDYSDTVAFFGAGLGQTFPRWKGVFNAAFNVGPITLDSRVRYIDAMTNRMQKIYANETSFTGVPSVWYFDFGVQAEVENMTLRFGLNNAFDKQPPRYAPNVQSGTDPSFYDVIGRRAYVSARLKF